MVLKGSLVFSAVFLISSLGFCRFDNKAKVITPLPKRVEVKPAISPAGTNVEKDKNLELLIRFFEQADAIHRESWWVLSEERRSSGRSPFGKVQRALQSSQKIKLSNKSLFRCDRYLLKKDILGPKGFPLRVDVYEKCSEKSGAKLIAKVFSEKSRFVSVSFFPENLEEVLGLGPSVINKTIVCEFWGNESGQLEQLSCKDWAQDRSKEQMIRLDTYLYQRSEKNMIKLRGKVYENLTDTRSIVADVPLNGKIQVIETELYPPPDEKPKLKPAPKPIPSIQPLSPQVHEVGGDAEQSQGEIQHAESGEVTPLPLPRDQITDPDVLMQQQRIQENQGGTLGTSPQPVGDAEEAPPSEHKGVIHGR